MSLGTILDPILGLILRSILGWIQLYFLVTPISRADAGKHFTTPRLLEFILKIILFYNILSNCHNSNVINSLLNAFRLKKVLLEVFMLHTSSSLHPSDTFGISDLLKQCLVQSVLPA